jgi:hypothetical protein
MTPIWSFACNCLHLYDISLLILTLLTQDILQRVSISNLLCSSKNSHCLVCISDKYCFLCLHIHLIFAVSFSTLMRSKKTGLKRIVIQLRLQ